MDASITLDCWRLSEEKSHRWKTSVTLDHGKNQPRRGLDTDSQPVSPLLGQNSQGGELSPDWSTQCPFARKVGWWLEVRRASLLWEPDLCRPESRLWVPQRLKLKKRDKEDL